MKLKTALLLLKIAIILGCGIKKSPKPLPLPNYEVKRIGSKVYVIAPVSEVEVKGFEVVNGFFVKEHPDRFCFRIRRLGGREVFHCVNRAKEGKPSVKVSFEGKKATLMFEEEGTYRIYPVKEHLIPKKVKEFKGRVLVMERTFENRTYAVTKVEGSVESEPAVVNIPPLQPPRPEPPEDVSLVVREGRLYLYWWGGEDNRYLVYRNGRLLTQEPIIRNVFVDDVPQTETVYEVVSVNKFGVRSEPARIIYKP